MTVLCKDCRWVERSGFWGTVRSFANCHHPAAMAEVMPDLVLGGNKMMLPGYAATMRLKSEPCGPEAKLFRPYRGAP